MELEVKYFIASWYKNTRMDKNIPKMQKEFPQIKFNVVELNEEHDVKCLPTIILLKDNKEIKRITGNVIVESLRKELRKFTNEKEE